MEMGNIGYMTQPRKNKRDMLATIKSPVVKSRMVARNTLEYETDIGDVITRLHDTDIVRKRPDKSIYLDTGGWNTKTTRARINEALPHGVSVYTCQGAIHVSDAKGKAHEFTQTVRIGPRGGVTTDIQSGEAASYDSVRALVDRYIEKLKRDGIPTDSAGDPWVVPDSNSGKYDKDTVLLWLADPKASVRRYASQPDAMDDSETEPYVFLTFIYNALKWSGHSDLGVGYQIQQFNKVDNYGRRIVCGTVRRYIRACLGYASS